MTSHPDKLFRDGLGAYQKKAPSTAWDRIESGLDRKRHISPWLKIAAGLLILIATSVVILQMTTDNKQWAKGREQRAESREQRVENTEQIAESREQIVSNRSKHGFNPAISTNMPQESNKLGVKNNHLPFRGRGPSAESRGQSAESSGQWTLGDQHSVVGDQALNNNNSSSDQNIEVIVSQENSDSILSAPTASAQVEVPKDVSAPIVARQTDRTNLTYSVEEVNSRFIKKECPADATSEKKNTSGIQKVVAVALDIRYEESLVGELREKKNEWLSINTSPKKREFNK